MKAYQPILFCVMIIGFLSQNVCCQVEKSTRMIHNIQDSIPSHLKRWGGLYIRKGNQIVEAPQEDVKLAKTYPTYANKGAWRDDIRITVMTQKSVYKPGEEIKVIHIVEAVKTGYELYIMGPKEIYGEYINNVLVTTAIPKDRDDPLIPLLYDGAVLPCPAVDYNYEITTYTFSKPGVYNIQWKLGELVSNLHKIRVIE